VRTDRLTVFIVDDDASVRDSIALMLGLAGYRTAAFASAEDFLAAWQSDWVGCVVADVRLPGLSGVHLQQELGKREARIPFVMITAHGDVSTARAAFKSQAIDFLEKPFDARQLFSAIETAFDLEERRIHRRDKALIDADKLGRLTARERQVLELAARGLHAKEIASELGISPRTVEVHKSRVMEKLGVRNVAELVRFAVGASGREA
jgi:RNA polymerase sigma factor (sigma-70 family)